VAALIWQWLLLPRVNGPVLLNLVFWTHFQPALGPCWLPCLPLSLNFVRLIRPHLRLRPTFCETVSALKYWLEALTMSFSSC
jgi:hypothetical protein